MMLIFLDCEFSHLSNRQCDSAPNLISIGLISEDGLHSFYAELAEGEGWQRSDCNQFVIDTVLPLLTGPAMPLEALRTALRGWFATLPGDLIVAVDFDLDFQFLLAAVGEPLPTNLPRVAFKVNSICDGFVYEVDVADFHLLGRPRHHALNDADALRRAFCDWKERNAE